MAVTQSIAGFLLMVAGLSGLILGRSIVSKSPVIIACQVLAVCLMIWARLTFGKRSFHAAANPTEGSLVTHGPYRFVRHPIYTSVCLFGWASCLGHLSYFSAFMAALCSIGAGIRMIAEERLLFRKYPEYGAYASRTKRIVPFVF